MRFQHIFGAIVLVLLAMPVFAGGFGAQLNWNKFNDVEEKDFGVGARLEIGGDIHAILAFDYYLVDDEGFFLTDIIDPKFFELSGNLAYTFPTIIVRPYVGGGIGIARLSFESASDNFFDDSESELGINLLGGVKFSAALVEPFVEIRYVIYSGDETFPDRIVFTAGIVF